MLKTKFVKAPDVFLLETELNEELSKIAADEVNIKYFIDECMAVIEFKAEQEYSKRFCSECAHWDDDGSSSSLSCFCTQDGKRKRYNHKACSEYKDIRD